jgi:hypothetical protein
MPALCLVLAGTQRPSSSPPCANCPSCHFVAPFPTCRNRQIRITFHVSPPRQEGRSGRSSRNVRRVAMDAFVRPDEAPRDASGEAVWSWHPDAGVKLRVSKHPGRRRLSSPVLRGEHGISRPTSRRECRRVRLYLLMLVRICFAHSPRTRLSGATSPGIPCALFSSRAARRCITWADRAAGTRRCGLR